MGGHCHPVRQTRPALPTHLPVSAPAEESDRDESEVGESDEDESKEGDEEYDYVHRRTEDSSESDDLESSQAEWSYSD